MAATLGIADLLEAGPRSTEDLAQATHTHAPSLYRLLRALSSVGVFAERADGRFGLTPLAEHLRTDAAGSLRAWAMFLGRPYTWSAWAHLLESVRTGEAAFPKLHGTSYWEYLAPRPEEFARLYAVAGFRLAGVTETGSPYDIIEGTPNLSAVERRSLRSANFRELRYSEVRVAPSARSGGPTTGGE